MGRKSKLTKENLNFINQKYKQGIEVKLIARALNITTNTVYRHLKRGGFNPNRKSTTTYKHDIIGKTFGYLKVLKIERNGNSTKSSPFRAICECKCGNIHDVAAASLVVGRTTSCGCRRDQYKKIRGKNSKSFTGHEEISGNYWGIIERRANKRGYEILISIEEAWDLFIKQNKKCALSGLDLVFANSNKPTSYTTASLDRIDSNGKYELKNVQWVHKEINIMKNVYKQEHFIEMCRLVVTEQEKKRINK